MADPSIEAKLSMSLGDLDKLSRKKKTKSIVVNPKPKPKLKLKHKITLKPKFTGKIKTKPFFATAKPNPKPKPQTKVNVAKSSSSSSNFNPFANVAKKDAKMVVKLKQNSSNPNPNIQPKPKPNRAAFPLAKKNKNKNKSKKKKPGFKIGGTAPKLFTQSAAAKRKKQRTRALNKPDASQFASNANNGPMKSRKKSHAHKKPKPPALFSQSGTITLQKKGKKNTQRPLENASFIVAGGRGEHPMAQQSVSTPDLFQPGTRTRKRKATSSVLHFHADGGFAEEAPAGGVVHGGQGQELAQQGRSGGILDHLSRGNVGNGRDGGVAMIPPNINEFVVSIPNDFADDGSRGLAPGQRLRQPTAAGDNGYDASSLSKRQRFLYQNADL